MNQVRFFEAFGDAGVFAEVANDIRAPLDMLGDAFGMPFAAFDAGKAVHDGT